MLEPCLLQPCFHVAGPFLGGRRGTRGVWGRKVAGSCQGCRRGAHAQVCIDKAILRQRRPAEVKTTRCSEGGFPETRARRRRRGKRTGI